MTPEQIAKCQELAEYFLEPGDPYAETLRDAIRHVIQEHMDWLDKRAEQMVREAGLEP